MHHSGYCRCMHHTIPTRYCTQSPFSHSPSCRLASPAALATPPAPLAPKPLLLPPSVSILKASGAKLL
jgi:hypothetical protein